MLRHVLILAGVIAAAGVSSCSSSGAGSSASVPGLAGKPKTYNICAGDDVQRQKDALVAFFDSHEGDTIQFCEGKFNFTTGLVMTGKRGITIKGAGRDKTYLRFADSDGQDGISINRLTGITVQDLTIYDAPGNGLRIFRSDYVTIRGVKVGWSVSDYDSPYGNYEAPDATGKAPASWGKNGSYAFYPVLCHKVLIEDSVSVGSSDAGVYVGQSSDILVRTTEAYHNVAGFEFENTFRAEFVDNKAHDNVGGFLVFDLPGRSQFGEKNIVHDNETWNNNVKSFAPRGAIVGDVPQGTGMLVLASDQLEIYRNNIHDNNTVGVAIVGYGLVDGTEGDRKYDFYPEGIHIYDNTFMDNGGLPSLPDLSRDDCKGDPSLPLPAGLPGRSDFGSSNDLFSIGTAVVSNPTGNPIVNCLSNNPSLLPAILVLKNLGKSAQIVWDGAVDPGPDTACATYPVDSQGVRLDQPNPNDVPLAPGEFPSFDKRYEARSDERDRPNYYIFDAPPVCTVAAGDRQHHTFNAWKFDSTGARKAHNGMCVENNTYGFSISKPYNALVSNFANVKFYTSDPTDPNNLVPADNTEPKDCPTLDTPLLAQTVPNFTPALVIKAEDDPHPSDAQLDQVCEGGTPGQINYAALAAYNCPRLDQYNLFADQTDPTRNPAGFGVPFDLNTILFSDYAIKYRFMFLPPDTTDASKPQKAVYQDSGNCEHIQIFNCNTATLQFPVGTVFAKTFAFGQGTPAQSVETRLLIKRLLKNGTLQWVGMAYEWQDSCVETGGTRCARLKIEGDTKSVSWDYDDPDPAAKKLDGTHPHYSGSAVSYGIPNAGACLICHSGDDREPGSAPIGPKVRNLNKTHDYGGAVGVMNQLAYLVSRGMLDLPAGKVPSDLERMPKWNVPGDADADTLKDEHIRTRAFLEVNCMHCHNSAGYAQNSGLALDAFDAIYGGRMGEGHGICKPPVAAGKAAERAHYDIIPGTAADSLLFQRIASTEAGIKMPPLARTVVDDEARDLINDWINKVLPATDADGNLRFVDPNAANCVAAGNSLPIDMGAP